MSLIVSLDVKFRFLFITWGEIHESWAVPIPLPSLPVPLPKIPNPLVDFNERGVHLKVQFLTSGK